MVRVSICCACLAVGCGSGGTGGGGSTLPLSIDASVTGAAPASADAIVVWSVSSSSPDYAYKFGDASYANGKVEVTLAGAPPADALNDWSAGAGDASVGIGYVLLVAAGTAPPDGKLPGKEPAILAGTPRQAIIFRRGAGFAEIPWPLEFPNAGYACGSCVDSTTGFDSFSPVDCSQLVLTTDTSIKGCNWT